MKPTETLDASELRCPMPLLRAKKRLNDLTKGQILEVITTDPHSKADFDAFCKQTGYKLLGIEEKADQDAWHLFIEKS